MTFEEAVSFMKESAWQGSILGLERLTELLDCMGNPQDTVPVIHIAGTNGKGSVSRMLEKILVLAGYKVGAFTSPYLVRITEQIRYGGDEITEAAFAKAMKSVKQACCNVKHLPTEFELITAAAFEYFKQMNCDIVVLEVGMGGALDATNVIAQSLISVICSIGIDHTAFLGNTMKEIAKAKAGIIKANGNVVTCTQPADVLEVIEEKCVHMNAGLFQADEKDIVLKDAGSLQNPYQTIKYRGLELELGLLGAHQLKNTSIVLKTVDVLKNKGYLISNENLYHGLKAVTWPGRFEILSDTPWVLLDGAHNLQGFEAVKLAFQTYLKGKKIVLVTGVMKDKDYYSMYDCVNPYVCGYFTVRPNNDRALSTENLAQILSSYEKPVYAAETPKEGMKAAISYVQNQNDNNDMVIAVIGSLYMAGEIRDYFGRK